MAIGPWLLLLDMYLSDDAVVKLDSSPPVCFYQKYEWVYVYLPRKSAKYSDHINLVSIKPSFTSLLH